MFNFPRLDFEVAKKNFINSLKITKIQSEPTTNESAEEELQLEVANEGFEIAFNVNYLREMLNTIEDKSISIQSFGNEKSALMKTTNDKRVLVLMPVRL